MSAPPSLVERLGYAPDARLAIINADDLGSSRASNTATAQAFAAGTVTSASLMVPCRHARSAAEMCRGDDVGVHLTLNCETEGDRWGPLSGLPTLAAADGAFPRTIEYVWDHADPDEVYAECAAQIRCALEWGVDVTHLDSHIGHMIQRRETFFRVYLDLAEEFRLPVRLTGIRTEDAIGFPFRSLAAERGVVGTDELIVVRERNGVGSRHTFVSMLGRLRPGVNELYVHPAVDGDEIRTQTPDWRWRVDDYRFLVEEEWLFDAVADAGVSLIGYRDLRDLVRAA